MQDEKSVYIVLSRSQTVFSQSIHLVKGDKYTHAALALDAKLEYMFSFGRLKPTNPFIGGFKREQIHEGIYKTHTYLPGMVMELEVSSGQYKRIAKQLGKFYQNRCLYSYNYLGIVTNFLGQSHQNNRRFFCSEFVYYILQQNGVCDLNIPRSMVRPQNLANLDGKILFEGNLKRYQPQLQWKQKKEKKLFQSLEELLLVY